MITHYLATVLAPAFVPPLPTPEGLTLDLVKQHLEYEDDDRNALIAQYMRAAASWVENYTGKALVQREIIQNENCFGRFIQLNRSPFASLTSIEYIDSDSAPQTLTGARVLNGRIYPPVTGWPSVGDYTGIMITYQAGYAETPADLISAQLLLIGHWFANREAANERPALQVDLAVESLCDPYRAMII